MIGAAILILAAQAPLAPGSTPEARAETMRFGACVADASTAKASATLAKDFRTVGYRNALRALSINNANCLKRRGRLQASNLLIAGAIAERLLSRDGADTISQRLATAAARPAVKSYSVSDAAAVCAVRSKPADAATLFASGVASQDEAIALKPLRVAVAHCAGTPADGVDEELRAMLATAAFRSVAADGKTG